MPIRQFGPRVKYYSPQGRQKHESTKISDAAPVRAGKLNRDKTKSTQSATIQQTNENSDLGLHRNAPKNVVTSGTPKASSLVSTRILAAKPEQNGRQAWSQVSIDTLKTPGLDSSANCPTKQLAVGQKVTARINGAIVSGKIEGFDYKGRAVVVGKKGQRRISDWDQIRIQGKKRSVESPYAGLCAESVKNPPTKLAVALEQALDIKVTAEHRAREYIDSLHNQGYSVFLCGGAIRDAIYVLNQNPQTPVSKIVEQLKDVDLVTDAPPPVIRKTCEQIAPEYEDGAVWSPPMVEQFGAVLVGGPKAGLENPEGLDIVSMRAAGMFDEQVENPDTGEKAFPFTFGGNLEADSKGRDFKCNSIYYDPYNKVIVDPGGVGIADAQDKLLRIARAGDISKDDSLSLRYFKFRMRGYTTDQDNLRKIRSHAKETLWGPTWKVVSNLARIAPKDARSTDEIDAFFQQLGEVMKADGCERLFTKRVLKLKPEVTKRIQKRFKNLNKSSETK
ncbi:MAG: hypothetical protein VYC39_17160 [Myxococcota bacterium]|nr:hypothetical protein [Myxococcota bacterium]